MSKTILTIGFELASPEVASEDFESKISLLDWDIVLFRPAIDDFISHGDLYKGKPSLSDSVSFRLKESCEHWRRELKQAYETGKTVIVYLPPLTEVYVDSGNRTHSGTGRNQKTTILVENYNNYKAIPISLSPISTSGTAMKLADRGSEILANYWSEFEKTSKYEVLVTGPEVPGCILTRSGGKIVGSLHRNKTSGGSILCLPDMDFSADEFLDDRDDDLEWSAAGLQFSARLVGSIIGLDRALRSALEMTPEPSWAGESQFILASEAKLNAELLAVEREVEEAQQRKEEILENLKSAGALRALLYEKGHALELAIIQALRIFGFQAESFKDDESEFDVVFECDEGRLIGEAEGKDNKPVNIDKLRQLSMNIHEDLLRDEVESSAKPVLFGNGFRLQPLASRGDPFTAKCHSAAMSASTALVNTPDMFRPVQYLVAAVDFEYARRCRKAILSSSGRISFPAVPASGDNDKGENDIQVDS